MLHRAIRKNPALWAKAKAEAVAKMGGTFSARAMQLAVRIYKSKGGTYVGPKTSANDLVYWTKEQWTYIGKPKKSRYLPKKAAAALTPSEKAATSRAKNKGTTKRKQWVKQPTSIAKKVAKFRHHHKESRV